MKARASALWDRETLARIGELCAKHHVVVLSDEIHCDLTDPGREYVPFASVSEQCRDVSVTCVAPTKTFSLAGLQTAAVMAPNPVLRHKVWRALNTDEVVEPNAFAVDATVAAFTKGDAWPGGRHAPHFPKRGQPVPAAHQEHRQEPQGDGAVVPCRRAALRSLSALCPGGICQPPVWQSILRK